MARNQLQRVLGRGFSMAACVGAVIGLGIMRTPGEIAETVSDPWLYMGMWTFGGLFVLMSLLFVGELIGLTPRSGGTYQLIKRAFGRYPGFVIGWADWMSYTSTMALKAVVAAAYLAMLVPSLVAHETVLAIAITSFFAALQLIGTKGSARIQEAASTIIGLIVAGIAIALLCGTITASADVAVIVSRPLDTSTAAWALVASSIIFTYDGWFAATYTSGEVRSGGRGVVQGSIRGFLVIFALYLLLNLALVLSAPLEAIRGNDLALAKALELHFGEAAGMFLIGAAVFFLLAHQNLNYMFTSRVLYALSTDGLGSKQATHVTEKGAPIGGVVISWAVVVGLILIGGWEFLLNLTVTLALVSYVACILGVFWLRRKEPDTERPHRAWGFPFVGWVIAIGWTGMSVFVAVGSPESAIFAMAAILVAFPVYQLLRRVRHLDEAEV